MNGNLKLFISNYNFNEAIKSSSDQLKLNTYISNYIAEYGEQPLINFVNEFWDDPSININNLKKKYSIPQNIGLSRLVKSYPNDKYIDFLKDCWVSPLSVEELIEKYTMKYDRISSLNTPVIYQEDEKVCPYCLTGETFYIDSNIEQIKSHYYILKCYNCNKVFDSNSDSLLPVEEASIKKETKEANRQINEKKITILKDKLIDLKCPNCQNHDLHIIPNNLDNLSYTIICPHCKQTWRDMDTLTDELETWKQHAAMMIKIKDAEKNLINNAMKNNEQSDVKFKKEPIITDEEGKSALVSIINEYNKSHDELWNRMYKTIRSLPRAEKILLMKIIELCITMGADTNWYINNDKNMQVPFKRYKPDEPIVESVSRETKLLITRTLLRNLLKNNLIGCGEEENFIDVPKLLVDNYNKIRDFLTPKNISNAIKYIVYTRDNYSCTQCGEVNRPLEVAYLSSEKNPNHLELMITLCVDCYDRATIDELLVSGILQDEQNTNNFYGEEYVSWQFAIENGPELDREDIYNRHVKLMERFDESNIILALAGTFDRLKEGKLTNNIHTFYNYVEGILNNSEEKVIIRQKARDDFHVDNWIKRIG